MPNKFPKPKSKRARKGKNVSYMYPQLHRDVLKAVSPNIKKPWFNSRAGDEADKKYETNVMGKFKCDNDGCSSDGWSSNRVAILIRGYSGNGYNAEVFGQRCRLCNALGTLTLDDNSYLERVAYRLNKWGGISVKPPDHKIGQSPPHREDLCEGCKMGYCQQGGRRI
ncbi:zinc-binding domain-containing protein [Annulohypoxylon maeteangense]|uniref:zinc-binding domain-containing protein n=1 Tax=Annulohypoxylon maeteangense TaxID=1927788 RepID=UPI002008B5E5|nr:zinc-binding domain-containing protein [Annulohypoxylon maeteangense]KAI0884011.1 zinc-binding domain-containing protein [Annulohypoxylon maeteangense]